MTGNRLSGTLQRAGLLNSYPKDSDHSDVINEYHNTILTLRLGQRLQLTQDFWLETCH